MNSVRVSQRGNLLKLLGIGLVVFTYGCGGGGDLAPLTGKVTHDGKPVAGGTLVFSPVGGVKAGASAHAVVQQDGTYKAETANNPGVKIGRVKVLYTAPEPNLTEQQRTDPEYIATPSPYAGLVPAEDEFEVTAGPNTKDIVLAAKKK